MDSTAGVVLRPWSEGDLPLLQMLLGDAAMMVHLGGPESPEQILRRHRRYVRFAEAGVDHMFRIEWSGSDEPVGSIGYWKKAWRDRTVYEMGWLVLPGYQGLGIATQAGRALIEHARAQRRYPDMHAFPSVENSASNAICSKLGLAWIEECPFEFPPGRSMRVNNWHIRLFER